MSPWDDTNILAEIARLTAALHANRCHPDYLYSVSRGDIHPFFVQGWEPNPEYQAAPGDECWRRRKEPT